MKNDARIVVELIYYLDLVIWTEFKCIKLNNPGSYGGRNGR